METLRRTFSTRMVLDALRAMNPGSYTRREIKEHVNKRCGITTLGSTSIYYCLKILIDEGEFSYSGSLVRTDKAYTRLVKSSLDTLDDPEEGTELGHAKVTTLFAYAKKLSEEQIPAINKELEALNQKIDALGDRIILAIRRSH